MGFFQDVDRLIARFRRRRDELEALCREAGWLRPRVIPPCVWVLRTPKRNGVEGERLSFTEFDAAVAHLTPLAEARRRALAAKAEAKRARAAAHRQRVEKARARAEAAALKPKRKR